MGIGETASLVEILWVACGAVGVIAFGILAWRAHAALRALRVLGLNGGRKIAGRTTLIKQLLLGATQVIVMATGIVGALSPDTATGTSTATAIATLGILVNEAIIMGVGIFGLIRGDVLDRYLAAHDATRGDAATIARHVETMAELTHNTEITTEARDGALEAFHAANEANVKIAETNRVAGEAAQAAAQSTDKLRGLMERLEHERKDREP